MEKKLQIKEILESLQLHRTPETIKKINDLFNTVVVAGSTTEVQYNKNGVLSSDSNFTRDPKTGSFSVAGNIQEGFGEALTIGSILGGLFKGTMTSHVDDSGNICFLFTGDGSAIGMSDMSTLLGHVNSTFSNAKLITVDEDAIEISFANDGVVGDDVYHSVKVDISGIDILFDNNTLGVSFNVQLNSTGFRIGDYTLPIVDGTVGQVLATDAVGVVSWTNSNVTETLVATDGGTSSTADNTGTLRLTPVGTIATHTVEFPENPYDGKVFRIVGNGQIITTLTLATTAIGGIIGGITTITAIGASFVYFAADDVWCRC